MANKSKKNATEESKKIADLEPAKRYDEGKFLTTNHGVRVNDNQNSLKKLFLHFFHFLSKVVY